jgi:hypothetical protein
MTLIRIRIRMDPHPDPHGSAWIRIRIRMDPHPDPHGSASGSAWIRIRICMDPCSFSNLDSDPDPHSLKSRICIRINIKSMRLRVRNTGGIISVMFAMDNNDSKTYLRFENSDDFTFHILDKIAARGTLINYIILKSTVI